MEENISKRIANLLRKNKQALLPSYKIEGYKGRQPLSDFHQWADGRLYYGAFLIRDTTRGIAYWVLFIQWNIKYGYYVVLFPEDRSGPIAEIHRVNKSDNSEELCWTYKPMKQDDKNEQRKNYFRKYFYDTDVIISIPTYPDELSDFISDLFSLAENRIKADELDENPPDYRDGFPEGRLYQRLHLARERNPNVVRIAKQKALEKYGHLFCQICGFDFKEKYGELGDGFIEAHHTVPVSELKVEGEETRVQDIAFVCSNCHRMLHRRRPWLTMEKLGEIIS